MHENSPSYLTQRWQYAFSCTNVYLKLDLVKLPIMFTIYCSVSWSVRLKQWPAFFVDLIYSFEFINQCLSQEQHQKHTSLEIVRYDLHFIETWYFTWIYLFFSQFGDRLQELQISNNTDITHDYKHDQVIAQP